MRPAAPASSSGHDLKCKLASEVLRSSGGLRFSQRAAAAVFQRSETAARVIVGVHGMRRSSQVTSRIQAALLQEQ